MDREAIRDQIRLATLIQDTALISDTTLDTIINQGMHEISLQSHWPWLEASATVSLVAATRTAALPADYDYGAVLVDDDHDEGIGYVSPRTFFELVGNDTGNTSTTPEFFTIWEDVLYFHPIPSANDTNRLTLYYYKGVTELGLDTDEPAFHTAFHMALVEYGKWKLWDNQEYFDQSERAFITYARYIHDMIAWYSTRIKNAPFLVGDGRAQRKNDPNIALLNI